MTFAHLHCHTEFSMLDGLSTVDGLMRRAAELGQPALAMTDHGNMFGAVDFYRAGLEHGVKPIIGCEFYVAPGSRLEKSGVAYHHLVVLAADQTGYRNLMRLTSRSWLEGFFRKPRIDRELLAEHAEGLIVLSGCLGGELAQHILAGDHDAARETINWHAEVFGDRYYLEMQDHGQADDQTVNRGLATLGNAMGVPLVVTGDSHYTMPADARAHDALLCIQTGKKIADEKRFRFQGEGYHLKSRQEMLGLFLPDEAVDNTLAIAERCNVTLDFDAVHLPTWPNAQQHLRALAEQGEAARYPVYRADAAARLKYELGVIHDMGFDSYFLIVSDIVDEARRRGIRVGPGRGSAAGCLVAYCLRITELDPLEHGLIFERFLNPDRVSLPDIDLDFDDRRRGEMIAYVREKYGEDRVAQIITYSTMKGKAAIKDAARVLGFSYQAGDRLTKMYPKAVAGREAPISEALEKVPALKQAAASGEGKAILELAQRLEGVRRQTGVHAAGVVIAPEPIQNLVPVMQVEDSVITQYDGGMVEKLGLLKMDFLGVRNLTVITDALEHING